jgi:hypothetical protein
MIMSYLEGLEDYRAEKYKISLFDIARNEQKPYVFHLHGNQIIRAKIIENLKYDLKLDVEGEGERVSPKIEIKFFYAGELAEGVDPLIKTDQTIKAKNLPAIINPKARFHIKNKSLYPLMKDREVLFFNLLEGEIIRGLILNFYRYEVEVSMKGGLLVTVMRHAIYDLRSKDGKCFLKTVQENKKEWQYSSLFVKTEPPKPKPKQEKPKPNFKKKPPEKFAAKKDQVSDHHKAG